MKKNKQMNLRQNKKILLPIVFIALIIIIATLFHYPIHIEYAIANSPADGYGISISFWRIVFEPALGLLLFFNRALYMLNELPIMLVWTLIVFVAYSIYRVFVIKERKTKRKFILDQIINLPLVIGLWFTAFVIVLFIPLPNNTIVNNLSDRVLVTTHSHTEYSHDGLITQKGLLDWHKRNSFDAFFITDHNNHAKTLEFVKAQRNNEFLIEPLVMCGEEFSGSNHLSLLGLKRNFSTKGKSDSAVVDLVRANNGVVLVNHWFDGEKKPLEYFTDLGVDGFEIANSATERSYNRKVYSRIKEFCKSNNLIMNGGLDFHGYGNACSIWNAFKIPNWQNLNPAEKEEAILNIIRSRNQSKLQVLIYKDRAYYDEENLSFSPLFTLVNYFRTLNIYQLLSWIFWISLLAMINIKLSNYERLKKLIMLKNIIPIIGSLSGLFLLALAFRYYLNIETIVGFTEMYVEYSEILFYAGASFLIYSAIVGYFRIKKLQ